MNRKEYSDKHSFTGGLKEAAKDLYPLVKKAVNPVKRLLLAYPQRAATIMFAVLLLNTALLFFIVYRKTTTKQPSGYAAVIKTIKNKKILINTNGNLSDNMSIGTWIEIKNIRDSLEYLMHKKVQTKEDTLCFMRLYKRYSLVDPSITHALKELKRKKQDSLHSKTLIK